MDKSLVTSIEISKLLYPIIGKNTLLCWVKNNDGDYEIAIHNEYVYELSYMNPIPCYTSEEIKRELIKYKTDTTYYYEEKYFYFINYMKEQKPNDLPIHVICETEVDCRAKYLLYLNKYGQKNN